MNLFFFLLLLIGLAQLSRVETVQTFVEHLRKDFRPFEQNENGSMVGDLEYHAEDKVWSINFKFWTNDEPVKRWALIISISKVEDDEHHNQYETYKSINIDGRSYLQKNKKDYPPGLCFLHDFLMKGPQIYSLIDNWIQEENGSEHMLRFRSENLRMNEEYFKMFGNELKNARLRITRKLPWVSPLHFSFQFQDDNGLKFRNLHNGIKVMSSNSDHYTLPADTFKITDEFFLVTKVRHMVQSLPSSLFMRLWNLVEDQ